MTKQPLVSIITPSYNQAAYIEATILSVLNQTYPYIEYIIIDGGSTDGSVDIIKRFENKLTYWISETDNGQTDAVNKGVAQCKGDIIAYINSDDVYEPNAVQLIANAYIQNPNAAVYYGKCATINESGNMIKEYEGGPTSFDYLQNRSMLPFIYQPACFFNSHIATRRPLFIEKNCIDYELLLHLSQYHPFVFIDAPVAQYRIHALTRTTLEEDQIIRDKFAIQLRYGAGWKVRLNRFKYFVKKLLGITK